MSTQHATIAPPESAPEPASLAAASVAEAFTEPSSHRALAQDLLAERRLVVVSNREPYRQVDVGGETVWQRTTGGLVSALDPVMRRCHGTWIAWEPNSENGEGSRERVPGEAPRFTLRRVPLLRAEVERYYDGMANNALWPLCHYFVDR